MDTSTSVPVDPCGMGTHPELIEMVARVSGVLGSLLQADDTKVIRWLVGFGVGALNLRWGY